MWPGPYGDFGSRKYLVASLDQSLKRMGLEYVDIFYHHRPDPETPLEETMGALDFIVRSGRALYVGISQYNPEQTERAISILKGLGTPCLIHQPRYNMFDRWIEDGLIDVLDREMVGCIVFSPLAQGLLTDRYLNTIPADSRAGREATALNQDQITREKLEQISQLNEIAKKRNQSLAQMSIAWTLRNSVVTSALIGASSVTQINDIVLGIEDSKDFSDAEQAEIDTLINS